MAISSVSTSAQQYAPPVQAQKQAERGQEAANKKDDVAAKAAAEAAVAKKAEAKKAVEQKNEVQKPESQPAPRATVNTSGQTVGSIINTTA
ncbi:MAG: hypothetical protein PHY62_08775 [Gallionella sp.]|jgi:hypothetical protein|nr:hypothetical protein [Gallionella sp.]